MPENHDELCAELFSGVLYAADLGWSGNIPGDTNDKQVAQALIEDDLGRTHTTKRGVDVWGEIAHRNRH